MRRFVFSLLLGIFIAVGLYLIALAFDRWLVPAAVEIAREYWGVWR